MRRLLLFLVILATPSFATIGRVARGVTSQAGTATSTTMSVTVGTTGSALLISYTRNNSNAGSDSCTYNGVAMSNLSGWTLGASAHMQVFTLANVAAGTANAVCSNYGGLSAPSRTMLAVEITGADLSSPVDTYTTTQIYNTTIVTSSYLPAVPNEMLIALVGIANNGTAHGRNWYNAWNNGQLTGTTEATSVAEAYLGPVGTEMYSTGEGLYSTSNGFIVIVGFKQRPNSAPSTVSATPTSGNFQVGTWYTFSATYRDVDGYADMSLYRMLIAYGVDGGNACYPGYSRADNKVWAGNGDPFAGTGVTLGSGGVISAASACDVDATATTKVDSGTDTTINFAVRFKTGFNYGGTYTKGVFSHVADVAGLIGGWTQYGTIFVNEMPSITTITPSGPPYIAYVWYTFNFVSTDLNGYADIVASQLYFGTGTPPGAQANSCFISLNTGTYVYLQDDAGAWTQYQPWGTAAILSNSQCDVDVAGTTGVTSGNTITYSVKVRFKAAYAGSRPAVNHVQDSHGGDIGAYQHSLAMTIIPGGPKLIWVNQN